MRPAREVAGVLDQWWREDRLSGFNTWQIRTLRAIKDCRTLTLGGHIDHCSSCGHLRISYNSCRNRHCPKCQGHKRIHWIAARESELLDVPYFHVVFTLPDALHALAMYQPGLIYDTLFKAAWQTVQAFAGKHHKAAMISILHTWGQNLNLHPHIHCIIPGGTTDHHLRWQYTRSKGKFLYPIKAMSKVFRAKYVALLRKKIQLDTTLSEKLFLKPWVVYAKRPFGSPASVIEYLGRYTHKVAITNHRILAIGEGTVTFSYKDYKQGATVKTMTLTQDEFVRRFALHILPKGFVRIRHYGFLSSSWKKTKLPNLQSKLNKNPLNKSPPTTKIHRCPECKTGVLKTICTFDRRGPPYRYNKTNDQQTTAPAT